MVLKQQDYHKSGRNNFILAPGDAASTFTAASVGLWKPLIALTEMISSETRIPLTLKVGTLAPQVRYSWRAAVTFGTTD